MGNTTSEEQKISDDMEQLTITDDMEQECLDAFFCPITREIMQNPVILIADGHTYEMAAIQQWFQTGNRISPLTGQTIASTNIRNNYAVKKAISEFLKKYPEHKKQDDYQKTLLEIIKLREQDLAEKNQSNQNKSKSNNMCTAVAEFLQNIDQSEYIDTFISNAIYSMDTLQLLTENDLKELIHKVGPRRVIYNEIQKLKATTHRATPYIQKTVFNNDSFYFSDLLQCSCTMERIQQKINCCDKGTPYCYNSYKDYKTAASSLTPQKIQTATYAEIKAFSYAHLGKLENRTKALIIDKLMHHFAMNPNNRYFSSN